MTTGRTYSPTLRSGRLSLSKVFDPPSGTAVVGRPLANFTFALNYIVSGLEPWSYHVFNILVHMLAACFLFGMAKRLFSTQALSRFNTHATSLALVVASLWALHPIRTMAVTYVSQLLESLMALFFSQGIWTRLRKA